MAAPELLEGFERREETYRLLGRATVHLGGLIGNGGPAAAESGNAYDRIRDRGLRTPEDVIALHDLAHLNEGIDANLFTIIERGFQEKVYFIYVARPSAPTRATGEERWLPVTSTAQTDLLPIVHERLRPPAAQSAARVETTPDREALETLISMQPGADRTPVARSR